MSVPAALAAPLLSTFAAPLPAALVAAPLPWRSLLQRRPRPLTLLDGGSGDAFFGEAAVRATLDDFKAAAPSMFGGGVPGGGMSMGAGDAPAGGRKPAKKVRRPPRRNGS